MAAMRGDADKVRARLLAGADPNDADALGMALCLGRDEVVDVLLNAGADLAAIDDALHFATSCGPEMFARILAALKPDHDELNAALYHACGCSPKTENLKLLLAAGANPNVMIGNGITPLMSAANWRNLRGVRVLLDAGAWSVVKTPDGQTAADSARLPLFATGTPGVNGPDEDIPAIVALLNGTKGS